MTAAPTGSPILDQFLHIESRVMKIEIPETIEEWNAIGAGYLFERLGIIFHKVEPNEVIASFVVAKHHQAWNGFLHAGSIISLADSACGYGTTCALPKGASGFTTIELKSNHLSTTGEGEVRCIARPLHQGRTTQVWDATVTAQSTGKTLAHFRCTQMILWPKAQ